MKRFNRRKKVSCVIPAYNEAERIRPVLSMIIRHPLIDEVIVVDDGSTDNTKSIIKNHQAVNLISYKKNKGKSYALSIGISRTKNNLVLLIDSDLENLTANNITDLLEPVIKNKADAGLSFRNNGILLGFIPYDLICKAAGIDICTGERVFDKRILRWHGSALKKIPGFGFEAFLNNLFIERKLRLSVVKWNKTYSPRKYKKFGLFRGTLADLICIIEVFKTVGFFRFFLPIPRDEVFKNKGLYKLILDLNF